ncbi:hypothetical protein [Sinomicrobium soli]|uniref:hypothetical protein n=1 Tax=Sinomicrobium sp. N-1-3-6 TaxID=2219864 RepID=UPI000DCBED9D|nr:hypothetical protein [Sinomicrobium sp. N-1-3-6]RAV29186.1 hypothetical protein DN748_09715 [Sinomicrobium sp. N-1-3-6]
MGNKIITEKDFWMCSMGNVPAQMQGTRKGTKKASGEIYITVEDTSTSSWIDFGCKKLMLLMALAAAAAVVALAVIGVLTVATGGAALIALGAVAGLVGAAIGAVAGGLMCGQKIASKREWSGSKSNFISQGSATITGDHTMVCAAGGTVSFAPQIKNWGQAIALGSANYIGGLMEGMMAGAAVGMGGAALSGGASALAGGGIRGLGQVSLNFVKSMPRNFAVNAIESVSKVGLAIRGVLGAQNAAATYGETGSTSIGDVGKGIFGMEIGVYESAGNILSGHGTWQDYVGMAMMVAPVGQGKRDLLDQKNKPKEDGGAGNKADDADAHKADEDTTIKTKDLDVENTKKDGEHDAFEAKDKNPKPKPGTPEHKAARWEAYKKKKPDSEMSYEEWSNRYEANMKNAKRGNRAADEYQKEIGWGEREVPMKDENGNVVRKLDIADTEAKKAVEVKDYSRQNVPLNKEIKAEMNFDKKLAEEGWDVEWVFKDKGPSKPLEDALNDPPPIKIKRLNK